MYQRIILLHVNDSIQVIFAARFIWRQHSNMTTLFFHWKTCDLFFLKITWFCVPWWFCYQGLIHRNAIPSCVIKMEILFRVWNLILFKGQKISLRSSWLVLFLYNKTSIQNSFVQFIMSLIRYCVLGCLWHTPLLTVSNEQRKTFTCKAKLRTLDTVLRWIKRFFLSLSQKTYNYLPHKSVVQQLIFDENVLFKGVPTKLDNRKFCDVGRMTSTPWNRNYRRVCGLK